jgi:toxin ParE1/3/4
MLPVVWTAQAEDDLLEIVQFIGERHLLAAQALASALKECTWPLSEHPMLFKRSARVMGCREIVVHPNYIAMYAVQETKILLVNVVHASRNFPS